MGPPEKRLTDKIMEHLELGGFQAEIGLDVVPRSSRAGCPPFRACQSHPRDSRAPSRPPRNAEFFKISPPPGVPKFCPVAASLGYWAARERKPTQSCACSSAAGDRRGTRRTACSTSSRTPPEEEEREQEQEQQQQQQQQHHHRHHHHHQHHHHHHQRQDIAHDGVANMLLHFVCGMKQDSGGLRLAAAVSSLP